ncbi:beta-galactosidase [Paenibacillus luteus]|uniref:beta-galactosidase n=1 Tax=Paenibacillus luteus TaxID=2545753 RepID=UPI001142527A|nr:beta-galactosidase [Paenibacillus luteus]
MSRQTKAANQAKRPSLTVSGEFPIGIFVNPAPSDTSDASYADIRAMNANFIVATNLLTTPATTDWALEKAAAHDLKILVTDTGIRWIQSEWLSQNDDKGEGLYLRNDSSIGQTFTTPDVDDLSVMILSFKKPGGWPEEAALTLSIYTSPSKETLIVKSELKGPFESDYPEFVLSEFPPQAHTKYYSLAANTTYYMELTTDSREELGPFLTSETDAYAGGSAFVNGEPLCNNLYFQITLKTPHGGTISAFSPTGRPSDDYIRKLVEHYKDHPAVLGYNLIDEPFAELYPAMKETSDRIKALDPTRLIYTNHYALNENGLHYFALENGRPMGYEDYINDWLATDPDMLSYDYYPYLSSGVDEKVHYQTLEFLRKQCLSYDKDLWVYIQSVAYDTFFIEKPNENQMRFQVYSSLAYGVKGYVYFSYATDTGPGLEAMHDGLILPDGSKNDTYEYAKKINEEVLNLGSTLLSLTSLAVYHTGDLPPSTEDLPSDFFLQPSSEDADASMIISYFKNEAGKTFVMFVNKDLEEEHRYSFSFADRPKSINEVNKMSGEEELAVYEPKTGTLMISFLPGEGKLFGLES